MRKVFIITIAVLLLCVWSLTATASTFPRQLMNQQPGQMYQVQKNLHRIHTDSAHQLSPLTHSPAFTGKDTEFGGISGIIYGLSDKDYLFAWVEAWTEKTDPGNADSINYSYYSSSVDSNGFYEIAGITPGYYYVAAFAEGYEYSYYDNTTDQSQAKLVEVFTEQITENINITLHKYMPGNGVMTGVVSSLKDGAPVANAYISAYSPSQPWCNSAISNEAGEYTITGLHSNNYIVQVWADGYLEQYYDQKSNWLDADSVYVADSTTVSGINFTLTKAGSICGTVSDEEGKPIAGAFLYAHYYGDSTWNDWTRSDFFGNGYSDENGNYIINNLPTGQYAVHVEVWSEWTWAEEWYDNKTKTEFADPVTVVEGIATTGINFVLPFYKPDGVIFGHLSDADGQPIADAWITAQPVDYANPAYGYTTSDKDGNYNIPSLPDGFYYVSAGAQSGWQYINRWWPDSETFDGAQAVEVNGNVEPVSIDFTLPLVIGTASISGHVQGINGRPLHGASISIGPANSTDPSIQAISTVWAWASTDSNGNYSVGRLPEGNYIAQANYWENGSFGQQWWDHQEQQETATVITLAKNQNKTDIDFSLNVKPIYGSITGVIIDSLTGLPVERAFIEIATVYDESWSNIGYNYWNNMSAITDKNGAFSIDWLYEGNYLVSVYANGAFEYYNNAPVVDLATPVPVTGGEKTEIQCALTQRRDGDGEITGRVVSEGDKYPFDIAIVTAKPVVSIQQWPQSELFYTAVTDSLGYFTLAGLPTGTGFYIYAFANWGVGEYYNNVYDPAQATLVTTNGVSPTLLEDIELPMYRWYDWDMENGGALTPGNAQVVGTVSDASGNAIIGGRILVFNEASQAIASVQTRLGGAYEIGGLAPGKYILQASHPGYNSAFNGNVATAGQAQMIVLGNGTLQVDFILSSATGIKPKDPAALPDKLTLLGNYPNPFNPETRIVFALPKRQHIQLSIYNLAGELVTTLISAAYEPGEHQIVWNGRDAAGRAVSSGVYMYQLESENTRLNGKMVLMK
ncbi:MAG TPA: carboxypeptidase regulatory-like domain-containing protein [bacterium]|nr:carboxypeptidase regulatory-like domain-containing protein [bacterium]HPN45301.1 carboxypeptidase regulatory-like domain-containing protein [bacterium]